MIIPPHLRPAPPARDIRKFKDGDSRDPLVQFAIRAARADYALRDALRALDAMTDFVYESKVVKDDLEARGTTTALVGAELHQLRRRIDELKVDFETRVFGRAEAATKVAAMDPDLRVHWQIF